ncbi:hypothetical protein FA13DRAFT_1572898, partial [Coprinellus micaceus]
FSLADAVKVNWKGAFKTLGANQSDLPADSPAWISDDGWISTTLSIDIPFHSRMGEPGTKTFTVGDFHSRSIVSVIKEKLTSKTGSRQFHYYPYKASWKRTADSPDVELYGEAYTSRAFREEHERVQRLPSTFHNKGLERVVVALMFWSDSTQLTSFGGASLWPGYLFFGNESKYPRGRPSEHLGQQIAYFLKLPDRLNDYLKEKNGGKLPSDALFTYCARQLFHQQWSVLLGREFVDAMKYGIILPCPDGENRCFFPRIFSYSADYPEKQVISGLRNNGTAPCHRCLIEKDEIFKLGAPSDTERTKSERCPADQKKRVIAAQKVIQLGYAVDNKNHIESKLQPHGLVPVETAFSKNLSELDFDVLAALAVDILHEFEIGVWKRLYMHLLRLLDAFSGQRNISLAAELDARYRATPAYGRDTIRKFPLNVSQMKRKAARDFEDLLQESGLLMAFVEKHRMTSASYKQCAIACFDSLLPEPHNTRLMSLLFVCAQWHALAKLRLHNDFTLALLDYTTTQLGAKMRLFNRDTCMKVPTKELPREAEARARKVTGDHKSKEVASRSRRPVSLSIFTIKFHYLGDYTSVIRRLGTTDSYSTQTGELYHREPKSWYPRTDRKDYEGQLARIERRRARLARIRSETELDSQSLPAPGPEWSTNLFYEKNDAPTSESPPHCRYIMGVNQNQPVNLNTFACQSVGNTHSDDYLQYLMLHFLNRLSLKPGSVPSEHWEHILLRDNRIYSHKLLKVNYTTYDIRRDQDILHVETPQCNVMMLNDQYSLDTRSTEHPYIYGRLLGVFHANVSYARSLPASVQNPGYHRIDFAWVHWYKFTASTDEFSLDSLTPYPLHSYLAQSFVDPSDIIRSAHLIPKFALGKDDGPIPKSQFVRHHPLWKAYYLNRFVDRDMFMRYQLGMSVGH